MEVEMRDGEQEEQAEKPRLGASLRNIMPFISIRPVAETVQQTLETAQPTAMVTFLRLIESDMQRLRTGWPWLCHRQEDWQRPWPATAQGPEESWDCPTLGWTVSLSGEDNQDTELGFCITARFLGLQASDQQPKVRWELYTKRLTWDTETPPLFSPFSGPPDPQTPYRRLQTLDVLWPRPGFDDESSAQEVPRPVAITMARLLHHFASAQNEIRHLWQCVDFPPHEVVVWNGLQTWALAFEWASVRIVIEISVPHVSHQEALFAHYLKLTDTYRREHAGEEDAPRFPPSGLIWPSGEIDPGDLVWMEESEYEAWLRHYAAAPVWEFTLYKLPKAPDLKPYKGYCAGATMIEHMTRFTQQYQPDGTPLKEDSMKDRSRRHFHTDYKRRLPNHGSLGDATLERRRAEAAQWIFEHDDEQDQTGDMEVEDFGITEFPLVQDDSEGSATAAWQEEKINNPISHRTQFMHDTLDYFRESPLDDSAATEYFRRCDEDLDMIMDEQNDELPDLVHDVD